MLSKAGTPHPRLFKTGVSLGTCVLGASAALVLIGSSAPVRAAGTASKTAPKTSGTAATYDNMRAALKPIGVQSANDILSRTDELSGRAVELQGTVCGMMSSSAGADGTPEQICLLQMPDAVVPLITPATVSSPALHPNAKLRVIALVNNDNPKGALTILALTDTPASANADDSIPDTAFGAPGATIIPQRSGAPSIQGRTVTVVPRSGTTGAGRAPAPRFSSANSDTILLQGNGAGAGDDLVVVPPLTETNLPKPGAAPATSFAPRRNATIRPQGISPWDIDAVDSQVPAYKALVLRHNPHLRDDQAEDIASALIQHGYAHHIDPRFLAAVVCVESGFNPYAVSPSGAMGLGQLMPFNLRNLGVQNAWDVNQNIGGSARMLRRLLDQFGGRPNGTLLAVAAYNAGANAVVRAGYRVPGGSQVQGYVWKIYYRYKAYAPEMFR